MKYYLIAGEKSGDLHGANLMRALKNKDPQAEFRFWGGEKMQEVGGYKVKDYSETAIMGIWEVIKNLRKVLHFIEECRQDILQYKPDVVILIDYAGFNMRIAKFCKQQGILNFYYISPKVWAWFTKRAYKIKKNVDRMFVILPFEVEFYKQFDYPVDYVGNPLLDEISRFEKNNNFLQENNLDPYKPIIAILPGSRQHEITHILVKMLSIVKHYPDYQFVIAGVRSLPKQLYQQALQEAGTTHVNIVFEQTYNLLAHAHTALVTSGTATLETALFEVPQVVCYHISRLTYLLAKWAVKLKYISLVNLVMDKQVAKELIQDDLNHDNLYQEFEKIIKGKGRGQILNDYKLLKESLGTEGASARAASLMVNYLKKI